MGAPAIPPGAPGPAVMRDAIGNVFGFSVGQGNIRGVPRHRQTVFIRCPNYNCYNQANDGNFTQHVQTQLAAPPIAVQIGFMNMDTTTAVVQGSFGFDTAMGALNSNQSKGGNVTFTNVTWGGAATATMAAAIAGGIGTAGTNPSVIWSDIMPCNGYNFPSTDPSPPNGAKPYTVFHMRGTQLSTGNSTNNATFTNGLYLPSATTEGANLGGTGPVTRTWRMYRSNTAANYATTNQAAFPANSGNVAASGVVMMVKYYTAVGGVTVATFGDSMLADYAASTVLTANGWGMHARLVEDLHTDDIPVEFCNFGFSGQTSTQILARFQQMAPYMTGVLCVYEMFSPNDYQATPSSPANSNVLMQTALNTSLGNLGVATSLMDQYSMTRVLELGACANAPAADGGVGGALPKQFWSGDSILAAQNAAMAAYRAQGILVLDTRAAVAGSVIATGNAAGQRQYQMLATGYPADFSDAVKDGTHRNDAANAAAATYFQPLFQSIL